MVSESTIEEEVVLNSRFLSIGHREWDLSQRLPDKRSGVESVKFHRNGRDKRTATGNRFQPGTTIRERTPEKSRPIGNGLHFGRIETRSGGVEGVGK